MGCLLLLGRFPQKSHSLYSPQKSPMINDPFAERDHVGVQGCIGTKLHHTKMAEMHEMPYLYRSFSAKEQKMSFPAKEQKIYK